MSSSAFLVFPTLQDEQIPAESRPFIEKVKKGFGFIPNLFAARTLEQRPRPCPPRRQHFRCGRMAMLDSTASCESCVAGVVEQASSHERHPGDGDEGGRHQAGTAAAVPGGDHDRYRKQHEGMIVPEPVDEELDNHGDRDGDDRGAVPARGRDQPVRASRPHVRDGKSAPKAREVKSR